MEQLGCERCGWISRRGAFSIGLCCVKTSEKSRTDFRPLPHQIQLALFFWLGDRRSERLYILRSSRLCKYVVPRQGEAWHVLNRKAEMEINAKSPLPRWTCIQLHLKSRIGRRFPLRCIAFHLAGILRELSPSRGYGVRHV